MPETDGLEAELDALVNRAKARVRAHPDVAVTEAELDVTFERAARRALRRPDPLTRSVALRKLARFVIPRALRPHLRRLLARSAAGATRRR